MSHFRTHSTEMPASKGHTGTLSLLQERTRSLLWVCHPRAWQYPKVRTYYHIPPRCYTWLVQWMPTQRINLQTVTHRSTESLLQATLPPQRDVVPEIESAKALGSIISITLEFFQLTCSFSSGSERQSVRKIEPRESAKTNSLLEVGCEQTVVKGCGKLIT